MALLLLSIVRVAPSRDAPKNKPRLLEYEYISALNLRSVAAAVCLPIGPAAIEASAPNVNFPLLMPSTPFRVLKTKMVSVDCAPN